MMPCGRQRTEDRHPSDRSRMPSAPPPPGGEAHAMYMPCHYLSGACASHVLPARWWWGSNGTAVLSPSVIQRLVGQARALWTSCAISGRAVPASKTIQRLPGKSTVQCTVKRTRTMRSLGRAIPFPQLIQRLVRKACAMHLQLENSWQDGTSARTHAASG